MPSDIDVTKSGSTSDELLLVIDAGGTKTAAWLVDLSLPSDRCVVGRGRSTAGNPLSVGFPEATRAIAEAAASAKHDAGRPRAQPLKAVLSIAGSANRQLQDHFIQSARETALARRIAVVSDVLPVLAAGCPNCAGIALIAGTGSVAFARAADGHTKFCGGWGYLLGDEGSGYAIGRDALRFALGELESSANHQPLTAAVLDAIGAQSTLDVTKLIYRHADPRAAIASVAPPVIAAADAGDSSAQKIIDAAAVDLAKLVARAARSIGFADGPFPLAIAGGTLVGSARLPQQLQAELQRLDLKPEITPVHEPLEGCVHLAMPQFDGTLLNWHAI